MKLKHLIGIHVVDFETAMPPVLTREGFWLDSVDGGGLRQLIRIQVSPIRTDRDGGLGRRPMMMVRLAASFRISAMPPVQTERGRCCAIATDAMSVA